MKTNGATPSLIALLNGSANFVMADLYTFVTSGGLTLRYSGAGVPITFSGNTWLSGAGNPVFERGKVTNKLGIEVATIDITISYNATDLVNGIPFIQFVLGLGFDNATLTLYRAFLTAWNGSAPVGTLIDFSGRVTSIKDISDNQLTMTVSSWLVLTNVNMGPDVFQSPCLNTTYDGACQAVRATFTFNGTVVAGTSTTALTSNLTAADGYFDQGQITFTSGPNNGLTRAVKTYLNASGAVSLVVPLPAAPTAGNTFTITAGDDHTMATCLNKFSNLIHFRGQPFIPPAVIGISGGV